MKKILTATIISLFILIHYTTSVFADCDGWAKSGETHRNAGNGCQYTCNGSSWSGPKNCDGQGNGQFQGEKAKTEEEKKKQAEAVEQRNKEAEQKVKEQGEKKTQENAAATAQQRANEAARQQAMLESQRQAEVERAKAQGATPQQIAQITEQYRQRSQQISQAQGTTNGQDIVGSDNPNATQFARDGYLATSANATGHVNLPAASATQSEIQRVQAALDAILKAELNGCPESVCGIQRARLEAQLQQLRNSANAATRSEANSYYNTYNSIRQTQAQIDALYAERTQLVSNIIRSGSHSAPSAQTTLRLQQIDKQIATLNKDAQGFQQELQGYSALQSRNSITQSQQQLRLEQQRIAREEAARRNQFGNNPQPSRQPVYNDPGNDTPSIPRTPRPAASTSPRVTTTPEIPEYAPGTTTNAVPSQSQTIRQSDQAIITTQMNTATQITNNIVRLFRLQAEADAAGNSARAKELADQIAQQWGQLDNIYQKQSGLSPSGQQMLRNRLTGLANSTNAQINLIENKVNASAAAYQENVSSNRNTLPGILGQVSNTVQRALCTSRGNRWSDNVGCVAMTTNTSNEVQVTPAEVTGLQGLLNNSAGSFQAAQLGITEPELNTIRDRVNEGQSIQNQLYVLEVKITGAESRGDQALADQLRREQAILLQDITDLTVNTGLSQTGQQQLQSYLLEQMQENTNRRTALQGRVGSLQTAPTNQNLSTDTRSNSQNNIFQSVANSIQQSWCTLRGGRWSNNTCTTTNATSSTTGTSENSPAVVAPFDEAADRAPQGIVERAQIVFCQSQNKTWVRGHGCLAYQDGGNDSREIPRGTVTRVNTQNLDIYQGTTSNGRAFTAMNVDPNRYTIEVREQETPFSIVDQCNGDPRCLTAFNGDFGGLSRGREGTSLGPDFRNGTWDYGRQSDISYPASTVVIRNDGSGAVIISHCDSVDITTCRNNQNYFPYEQQLPSDNVIAGWSGWPLVFDGSNFTPNCPTATSCGTYADERMDHTVTATTANNQLVIIKCICNLRGDIQQVIEEYNSDRPSSEDIVAAFNNDGGLSSQLVRPCDDNSNSKCYEGYKYQDGSVRPLYQGVFIRQN